MDADAQPDVSVLIPTRDRWPLLARALSSALKQQDVSVDVVVVDDGSRDETEARLGELADDRVRVLRNDASCGVARARNRGLRAARGRWVAFLDDDDLWAPNKLALQLEAAAGAGWGWTATTVVDERLTPLRFTRAPSPEQVADTLLITNLVPALSSVIVRTDLLCAVDGFDEDFSAMADWDLWIRISRLARGSSCSESLVGYVEHGSNMLAGAVDPMLVRPEFDRLARKHAGAAAAAGVPFGELWWSYWIASNHRFQGRRLQASRTYLACARRHRMPGAVVRAAGALGGEAAWSRVRSVIVGSTEAPAWLEPHRSP